MIYTESIGTNFYVQKLRDAFFKSIDCKLQIFDETVELIQKNINVFLSEN